MDKQHRPLADETREKHAHELFPLDMPPEEYVARFGSGWGMCSFPSYSYRDAALDEWLQRFDELMRTPGKRDELRAQFLTPAEIEHERQLDKTRWD